MWTRESSLRVYNFTQWTTEYMYEWYEWHDEGKELNVLVDEKILLNNIPISLCRKEFCREQKKRKQRQNSSHKMHVYID